jgi:hypothetical protein
MFSHQQLFVMALCVLQCADRYVLVLYGDLGNIHANYNVNAWSVSGIGVSQRLLL